MVGVALVFEININLCYNKIYMLVEFVLFDVIVLSLLWCSWVSLWCVQEKKRSTKWPIFLYVHFISCFLMIYISLASSKKDVIYSTFSDLSSLTFRHGFSSIEVISHENIAYKYFWIEVGVMLRIFLDMFVKESFNENKTITSAWLRELLIF